MCLFVLVLDPEGCWFESECIVHIHAFEATKNSKSCTYWNDTILFHFWSVVFFTNWTYVKRKIKVYLDFDSMHFLFLWRKLKRIWIVHDFRIRANEKVQTEFPAQGRRFLFFSCVSTEVTHEKLVFLRSVNTSSELNHKHLQFLRAGIDWIVFSGITWFCCRNVKSNIVHLVCVPSSV